MNKTKLMVDTLRRTKMTHTESMSSRGDLCVAPINNTI